MSPEQHNNGIEERLREYAQKRRELAGDVSLHPANRRLLQQEVAAQFKTTAVRSRWLSWTEGLPRWRSAAFACGVLALLAGGIWFVSSRSAGDQRSAAEFAKLENAPAATPAGSAAPAVHPVSVALAKKAAVLPPPGGPAPVSAVADARDSAPHAQTISAGGGASPGLVSSRPEALKAAGSLAPAPSPARQDKSSADFTEGARAAQQQQVLVLNQQNVLRAQAQPTRNYKAQEGAPAIALNEEQRDRATAQVAEAGNPVVNNAGVERNMAKGAVRRMEPRESNLGLADNAAANGAQQSYYFNNQAQNAPQQSQPGVGQRFAAAPAQQSQQLVENRANIAGDALAPASAPLENYARVDLAGAAGASPVLSRFVFQQRGNIVRITDSDESVYEGTAGEPAANQEFESLSSRKEKDAAKRNPSAGRGLTFRAAGTNRTTRQLVVLTGVVGSVGATQMNLVDERLMEREMQREVAAPVSGSQVPAIGTAARALSRPAGVSSIATNAVEGTLRVGSAPERPFRALRVP